MTFLINENSICEPIRLFPNHFIKLNELNYCVHVNVLAGEAKSCHHLVNPAEHAGRTQVNLAV